MIDVGKSQKDFVWLFFVFCLAQLEVEVIKTLERSDLLRFYDFYISLQSKHRKKLSVHVNPSALVENDEKPDELAATSREELPPTSEIVESTTEVNDQIEKLTEQPAIVDSLIDINKTPEETVPTQKDIKLPNVSLVLLNKRIGLDFL